MDHGASKIATLPLRYSSKNTFRRRVVPSHGLGCHINQLSDCSPLRSVQGGSWDHLCLRGERPWIAQVLPVSICALLSQILPAEPLLLLWSIPLHPSLLSDGEGGLTSPQPLQQAPEGTHMWWSCCHLACPTTGQLPEEHTSSFFHQHLSKINNLPQNSPSWAVWSTRPVCWAGGRQEASRTDIKSLQSLLLQWLQQSVVLESLGQKFPLHVTL